MHSLRAGGATAAANLGVNDRLFKKHGRWKSEKVKNGYIHENIEAKLIVTEKSRPLEAPTLKHTLRRLHYKLICILFPV